MKDTGITRKVDDLGRAVIAIEIRKGRNIQEKDPIEIFVKGYDIYMLPLKEEDVEEKVKNGAIIRRIDELGRVVIPIEIRRRFDINEGDYLDLYLQGEFIIFRKRVEECVFCGNKTKNQYYNVLEKRVCYKCIDKLTEELEVINENKDSQKKRA